MATRTVITLVDDLSGKDVGEEGRTVAFSFDGVDYQIDLGEKNFTRLEKALDPFISAATRVGRVPARRRRGQAAGGPAGSRSVRDWARDNGYAVAERGRVPQEIMAAYNSAH